MQAIECADARLCYFFFFSSRRRHTRSDRDWSSDVCSSDLEADISRYQPLRVGDRQGSHYVPDDGGGRQSSTFAPGDFFSQLRGLFHSRFICRLSTTGPLSGYNQELLLVPSRLLLYAVAIVLVCI